MRAAPAALLSALLLVTGCGIRATDVVEAGEPAVVEVVPHGKTGTVLYFVSSSSAARLMPVVREADFGEGTISESGSGWSQPGAYKALALLFIGPSRSERDAGLRTELPTGRTVVKIELSAEGVQVSVDRPVTGLSEPARQQLFCTAAQARTADRGEAVRVTGTDGVIGPAHCAV
ncbi:hypothetical protein [Streptomyces sp. NPDC057682]|uniref:hypothetical protein n=1 Tax=unclassified Streptomyces TaxID=2593676 RepID=UPI003661FF40